MRLFFDTELILLKFQPNRGNGSFKTIPLRVNLFYLTSFMFVSRTEKISLLIEIFPSEIIEVARETPCGAPNPH